MYVKQSSKRDKYYSNVVTAAMWSSKIFPFSKQIEAKAKSMLTAQVPSIPLKKSRVLYKVEEDL